MEFPFQNSIVFPEFHSLYEPWRQHIKLSDALSWGPSAINLVVDEDLKKPTNQTNQSRGQVTSLIYLQFKQADTKMEQWDHGMLSAT